MDKEREELIRKYAAGEITWSSLRCRASRISLKFLRLWERLGLRYRVAPMERPNRDARMRGRALIRELLKSGDL